MLILMFALWLILNGRITVEVCAFGVVLSAVFGVFMKHFLGYNWRDDKKLLKKSKLIVEYLWVLFKEVIKANLKVIELVWNRNIPVKQTLITFPLDLKTDFARAVLANSITLTPGTITVSVVEDQYTVHCLNRSMIEGLETGEFIRLLKEWEA